MGVYDDLGTEALRSILKMSEEDAYVGHLCDMRIDDSIHSSSKRVNDSRFTHTTATNYCPNKMLEYMNGVKVLRPFL